MAMLIPPTPSPSTSSTSTTPPSSTSFYSPASCLAIILRRILCSNGLPYSSPTTNYFTKEAYSVLLDNSKHKEAMKEVEAPDPAPPGVVARLMGLNSLPGRTRTTTPSPQRLKGLNDGEEVHRKRVDHGSLLLEVVPTSVKVETEYIVLSFLGSSRPRRGTKGKRSSCKGKARVKQQPDMEAPPDHDHHHQDSTMLGVVEQEREEKDGGGGRPAGARGLKNGESECGSENSSPVSVLNFGKFADRRVAASPEEDSELAEPGPGTSEVDGFTYKRKLHKEGSGLIRADDDRDSSNSSSEETSLSYRRRRTCQAPNQSTLCSEIRRLSNVEVAESDWIHKTACHWIPKSVLHRKEVEGISKDLELEIFSQLIEEVLSHFALTC